MQIKRFCYSWVSSALFYFLAESCNHLFPEVDKIRSDNFINVQQKTTKLGQGV